MKSQNCPNLSMAMKALLFVFSNTVIRLGFLYAFLSSSISAKENLLCFLQHNTDYVSQRSKFFLPHNLRQLFGRKKSQEVARIIFELGMRKSEAKDSCDAVAH